MKLYEYARKVNKIIKEKKKEQAGRYLSPVRRMERFAPIHDERYVAMTFDDGPMNLPPNPTNNLFSNNDSLTKLLIEILSAYHATGTFNIIGTTKDNYPDKIGKIHSPSWGGVQYDHYPEFEKDDFAGAVNQPELVRMLIDNGNELSNHGYQHILFGPNKMVYGSRFHFKNIVEVVDDITKLHELVQQKYQYTINMSRPPHYIDKFCDGYNSFDAYALLGYDYLAASFDGGGWLPTTGDYQADIQKMVNPLEAALKQNANSLNGQLIFQKDGYNMSLMTPVAHALEKHLQLLKDHEYRVITVSELKAMSPFEDIDTSADYIEQLRKLDLQGNVIGYKNNTFKPNKQLTHGEMLTMTLTKEDYKEFLRKEVLGFGYHKEYKKHPYYIAYKKYGMMNEISNSDQQVSSEEVKKFFYEKLHKDIALDAKKEVLRRDYINLL